MPHTPSTPEFEREVLDRLGELTTALKGIDGQPETGFIAQTNKRLAEHAEMFKEDRARISALEKWKWHVAGALGLAMFILGLIFKR
jgi:hypothetical protein